jgi:hypothetical protein
MCGIRGSGLRFHHVVKVGRIVKAKKVIVDVDIKFLKCPNKKHKLETAVLVGGDMDGFISCGCSCAAKVLLSALEEDEKKAKRKKK